MDPRGDGAVGDFQFTDATHVRFKIRHYTPDDPLCCPSSTEDRAIDLETFHTPIETTNAESKTVLTGAPTKQAPTTALVASFDCQKAVSQTEIAICSDASVAGLDHMLGQAFSQRIAQTPPSQLHALRADESAWIKNRDAKCGGDLRCLAAEIQQRLNVLQSR